MKNNTVDVVTKKSTRGGVSPEIHEGKSNPQPFLRISPLGKLIYANDLAWMLLRSLGWRRQLLPKPFLTAVREMGGQRAEFKFEVVCGKDFYSFLVTPGYGSLFFNFHGVRMDQSAQLHQTVSESQNFTSSVAHDLRGSLRAIRGLTQAALEDCEPALGKHAELLRGVTTVAERLNRFLDGLLELSKSSLRAVDLETIDAARVLQQMIKERPEWQLPQADVRIIPASIVIRGNLPSLVQCLSNLLSNAVKFVRRNTRPRVLIYTEQNGRHTKIVFEDNGIGIPKEDLPNLFKPLNRSRSSSRFEGTGLGLAIVQTAITRMGGRVGVQSQPGKGSRFWLELFTVDKVITNGNQKGWNTTTLKKQHEDGVHHNMDEASPGQSC